MGHFDKFKHNTLKNNTFLRLLFPHFHIVKPTSWLDVSRVFRRRQQLQWRLNGKNLVLLIFSNESEVSVVSVLTDNKEVKIKVAYFGESMTTADCTRRIVM